jgi:starch synthase (maltosyl-transferring)
MIGEVKRNCPEAIFLAEAFTRPKIMYRLAKLGFTQSYTYFAWRDQASDLAEYMTELTTPHLSSFFRPNFWPNTPDILTGALQRGGRPAFIARLVLAATMSSSYGIYGPAFELMEHTPGPSPEGLASEEYLDSEKYEIRRWDVSRSESLREIIAIVNQARRANPALQSNRSFRAHRIDNGQIIAYSKESDDLSNVVLVAVNLDPEHVQSGWLHLPVEDWGIAADEPFQVYDLLTGARYTWQGGDNYIELDPQVMPAHLFVVRRRKGSGWEFE